MEAARRKSSIGSSNRRSDEALTHGGFKSVRNLTFGCGGVCGFDHMTGQTWGGTGVAPAPGRPWRRQSATVEEWLRSWSALP